MPADAPETGLKFVDAAGAAGQTVLTEAHALSFAVTLEAKGTTHPHHGQGSGFAFTFDGAQAPTLTEPHLALTRPGREGGLPKMER